MDTAKAYGVRFAQLRARYLRLAPWWDWERFVDWLISLRPRLRPATYRQYRSAVVHAMRQEAPADADLLIKRLGREGVPAVLASLPPRTSARKSKSLGSHDWGRLVATLRQRGGRWDELAVDWLYWGSITGLRPVEWRDATLRGYAAGWALDVKNAKHTRGRAHGEHRTVHLQIDAEQAQELQCFLGALQSGYHERYQGCRLALRRATKALWPHRTRHPTLYTGRHQFSADAKASGLAPEQIAALMGHAVTSTHQTHYGKRRCGRGGLQAVADPRDVQRVRERMQACNMLQADVLAPGMSK